MRSSTVTSSLGFGWRMTFGADWIWMYPASDAIAHPWERIGRFVFA